jgi:large subunit ribosomal protein L25
MAKYALTAKSRDGRGKGLARRLRRDGLVPAVLYGESGENRLLAIEAKQLDAIRRTAGRGSFLIDLEVEGDTGERSLALMREVQHHPTRGDILHVDLQHISLKKKIHLTVPVVLSGEPVGVKTSGGVLELLIREVEVECLPGDIPTELKVDVSGLDVGDSLHVSDVSIPAVTILTALDTAVATVARPTVVAEEKPAEGEEVGAEVVEGEGDTKAEPARAEKSDESKGR